MDSVQKDYVLFILSGIERSRILFQYLDFNRRKIASSVKEAKSIIEDSGKPENIVLGDNEISLNILHWYSREIWNVDVDSMPKVSFLNEKKASKELKEFVNNWEKYSK